MLRAIFSFNFFSSYLLVNIWIQDWMSGVLSDTPTWIPPSEKVRWFLVMRSPTDSSKLITDPRISKYLEGKFLRVKLVSGGVVLKSSRASSIAQEIRRL